jgi:Right handed beta helix region
VGAQTVRTIAFLPILLTATLVCLLPAAPALAQAPRTFVSATGNDSNNCTNVATPCRHFAAAYAATAPNGEIDVLDPANYGQLTITGPVSIEGHGWATVSALLGGSGIAIGVSGHPGDKINIIGVVLEGTPEGNTGIGVGGGVSLTIRDCKIRNFGSGIEFQLRVSDPSQIFVSNTLISNNTTGIYMNAYGSGAVNAIFDHVETINNTDGLYVTAGNAPVNITFTDSVSANNTANGIQAFVGFPVPISIMVRNSTIANNGANGLEADVNTTIRVTRSTITGNGTGWLTDFGAVLSYGDNNIDGNGSANTEPPNPLTYK